MLNQINKKQKEKRKRNSPWRIEHEAICYLYKNILKGNSDEKTRSKIPLDME